MCICEYLDLAEELKVAVTSGLANLIFTSSIAALCGAQACTLGPLA